MNELERMREALRLGRAQAKRRKLVRRVRNVVAAIGTGALIAWVLSW